MDEIGEMAIHLGFLSLEKVKEAKESLPADTAFDEHLFSMGVITLAQLELIHENLFRGEMAESEIAPLFGEILVREGWVSPEGIEESLRIQKEMAEDRDFKRIGEILQQSDVISNEIILQVLKIQGKTLMTCKGCHSSFNVMGFQPGRRFRCLHCRMPMVPGGNEILVDETMDARGDTSRMKKEENGTDEEQFGKFRLERLLGSKQMRPVYRAVQESLNRVVALHLFSKEEAEEIEVPGDFFHPRIIPILETGIQEGTPFVATEHVTGKTFDEMHVPPREAMKMIREIARALQEAHQKGLSHKNIHPRNIMKGDDGNVWLMNFGLPPHPHKTAALSPEQEQGKKGDGRSDVWALAATLRLLLGSPPELEILFQNALQRDPLKRYRDAGAFADDLDLILQGERVDRLSWSGTKKILLALIGGGLLLGCILAYSLLKA